MNDSSDESASCHSGEENTWADSSGDVEAILLELKGSSGSNKSTDLQAKAITKHDIYCYGELLKTVQLGAIYDDSKHFVDMKMRKPASEILESFRHFMNETDNNPSKNQTRKFVEANFEEPGSEFEDWIPMDWRKEPKFLRGIKDQELRKFASDLNDIWKFLGRKMTDHVKLNPELYSIIYVPNPVIVPGGRFREFYYWDSYWIIKGLLLSEMYTTVRGMLSNFVSIVDRLGFIPNGGRVYYEMRSQPPMLIPMVHEYLKATSDWKWLEENLWLLEKEFDFWMVNRTVTIEKDGKLFVLARYYEKSKGPRPESYKEDVHSATIFRTQEAKEEHYSELKTAAETGWDFSTRWFIHDGTKQGNLTHTKAHYIVPVELNSIIYRNAVLLAEYNERMGNMTKVQKYRSIAEAWKVAVEAILWHEEVGAWLDYDLLNEVKRDYFFPTNVVPLWTNCYDVTKREDFVAKVMKYLEKNRVEDYLGGIPTTLERSGEQWDYPNAWPPLQYFVIMALDMTGDAWAQKYAYELSQRWVRSNYKAFNESTYMYEKYDATQFGVGGDGGEYAVQTGFGWTNGLVMDLINKYGQRLTAYDHFTPNDVVKLASQHGSSATISTAGQLLTGILAIIISLAAGFIGMVMYKRRHYYAPGPSTMPNNRRVGTPSGNLYRKRIAYTELKDMSND
ncbi:trehalase-like isoform X2 [Venturia canescens]|uniref:trehalase-like isoform X2 n=1 Tax=Venturia canescens TaxID=32260 RepID=UPI001C9CE2BD|nr:trehalase-like isoform X2 [Venturia canescens]